MPHHPGAWTPRQYHHHHHRHGHHHVSNTTPPSSHTTIARASSSARAPTGVCEPFLAAAAGAEAASAHPDVHEARPFPGSAVRLLVHAPPRTQLVVPRRSHRRVPRQGGGGVAHRPRNWLDVKRHERSRAVRAQLHKLERGGVERRGGGVLLWICGGGLWVVAGEQKSGWRGGARLSRGRVCPGDCELVFDSSRTS